MIDRERIYLILYTIKNYIHIFDIIFIYVKC